MKNLTCNGYSFSIAQDPSEAICVIELNHNRTHRKRSRCDSQTDEYEALDQYNVPKSVAILSYATHHPQDFFEQYYA